MSEGITEHKLAEEELLLLQKINNMLNAGVEQEEVFKTITNDLRSLYNYDSVAIHLLNNAQKYVTIEGYSADPKVAKKLEKLTGLTIIGYKIPLYKGSLFKEVIETGKPVITDDISWVLKSYVGRKSILGMAEIAARMTKAEWGIAVPLSAENTIVGVIGCGSVEILTDEDVQRLANFSSQVGLAIVSAQNHERLKSTYDELRHSNQLKDLFIDIIRHDLINPITVVKGMSDQALREEEDIEKKEIFQSILEASDVIIDLIENAYVLARLESGEKLELKEDDLGATLRSATEGNIPLADEKKIRIRLDVKGEFKAPVNPLIYDVFSNLISNALKYGPENSEVVVGIEDDAPNWKISVSDKGEGVPNEYKESIFNRFERIKKGSVEGTGLGLAIVKKVVEAHNGRVWVEDNPEGGSMFFVTLPKAGGD